MGCEGVTIIDSMPSPQEELNYGHLVSSDITNPADSEQKIQLPSPIYSSWHRVAIAPNPQATFFKAVSNCIPGWTGTHCIDQVDLELRETHLPLFLVAEIHASLVPEG